MLNVALHGLGRVGRSILRRAIRDPRFNIVAVNDLNPDVENIAYGLNYDSVYGVSPVKFAARDSCLWVGERRIHALHESEISSVPWAKLGADVLIDSSGVAENIAKMRAMTESKQLGLAIKTCPAGDADFTMTLGCNEDEWRASKHRVISSNTCDATAIAPVLAVLERSLGIEDASVTILHPWLNHQNLLDARPPADAKKNYELGRAAEGNIIAKTTSAEMAIRAVLPELERAPISALSYRIPTPIVACADLAVRFRHSTTKEELLSKLTEFQRNRHWKLIDINREPLVSSDFKGSEYSAVLEERLLTVQGRLGKLTLWYDNESGYAARVLDQVRHCLADGETAR